MPTATPESREPLTIIAGGGGVPVHVAAAATAGGRPVQILGIRGEADSGIAAFPHAWIGWGEIGRIDKLIKDHGSRDLVLVGTIKARPDFRGMKLDLATMRSLKDILGIVIGGDSDVMSGTVRFFEKRGQRVVGAHEIAQDLVAAPGPIGDVRPGRAHRGDIEKAMHAARAIGVLDAGQAAVAVDGRVIALEGAEGTDAMLRRVAEVRAAGRARWNGRAGVLAKRPKPQQDLRVDMPTIGPNTVRAAADAGLAGIAVAAGKVMIPDRRETVSAADAAGLFLVSVEEPA